MLLQKLLLTLTIGSLILAPVNARIKAEETQNGIHISNDRVAFTINKRIGNINEVSLDGVNLLGPKKGNTGQVYLTCNCVEGRKANQWIVGSNGNATYELVQGQDAGDTSYADVLAQVHFWTGQSFYFWWFLRDGETGLHTFTRLTYANATRPDLGELGELRWLFRPNTDIFTHQAINKLWPPLPADEAIEKQVQVEDATWYLGNTPSNPYVNQFSNYFTKYTFSDSAYENKAHGIFADGTRNGTDGKQHGVWRVVNSKETFYGGPFHYDLMVDGGVYNKYSTTHYGNR
ncbi:galactose mutarotase-like domain-containing protein [Powellomyces hirtus]|nr:galactose mutarotase-like domain-containing protein [Powellomyces hirtus]